MTYKFRIASPCSADWNQMKGDDRVRFCEECNLNVYNFAALAPAEIEQLVAQREGRLCARLYQRSDGTILTKNCPVGFRAALLRASGFATATLSALLSLVPDTSAQSQQGKQTTTQTHPLSAAIFLEITDPVGAVIPRAQITITNKLTGATLSEKTNEAGQLRMVDLPKGKYEISISSFGFKTKTLHDFEVPASELKKVPLEIGAVTMGVVVIQNRNPVKRFFSRLRHLG